MPNEYIPAVKSGVEEAMANGVLAGYPVVDIKAELYFGSYHDVDSSEMAFKIAGSMALQDGVKAASPVLLEPVMRSWLSPRRKHGRRYRRSKRKAWPYRIYGRFYKLASKLPPLYHW